jgi:hypothetical protein
VKAGTKPSTRIIKCPVCNALPVFLRKNSNRCHAFETGVVIRTYHIQFLQKKQNMKLSKSLLSAILIGIVVQTTSSCKKDKLPDPKAKQEAKKQEGENKPGSCPACGMG